MTVILLSFIAAAVAVGITAAAFLLGVKVGGKPKRSARLTPEQKKKQREAERYMRNFIAYDGEKQE